jgi:long-subunit fatty acid transport protein
MQHNVIAYTEGPTSNYYNPALITELKGTQIEVGTTLIFPSRKFESAQTGKTEKAKSQIPRQKRQKAKFTIQAYYPLHTN